MLAWILSTIIILGGVGGPAGDFDDNSTINGAVVATQSVTSPAQHA
jgi:hypothetical protein